MERVGQGVAALVEVPDPDDEPEESASGDAKQMVVEVASVLLGAHAVEGAVLRVPLGDVGEPAWESAERDRALEAELSQESSGHPGDEDRQHDQGG